MRKTLVIMALTGAMSATASLAYASSGTDAGNPMPLGTNDVLSSASQTNDPIANPGTAASGAENTQVEMDALNAKIQELQAQLDTLKTGGQYAGTEPGRDEIPTGG